MRQLVDLACLDRISNKSLACRIVKRSINAFSCQNNINVIYFRNQDSEKNMLYSEVSVMDIPT